MIRKDGTAAVMNKPVRESRAMSLLKVIGGAVEVGGRAFSSSLTGAGAFGVFSGLVFSAFESIDAEVLE